MWRGRAAFAEQLVYAIRTADGQPVTERTINGALAAIQGIGPHDETEAMLAAQMVATHGLAMSLTKTASASTFPPQIEAALNGATKLMRTYVAQMEALIRYRRRGEQTVRVEHVHVHSGGQAVVGVVNNAPRVGEGEPNHGDRPRAQLVAYAPEPALRSPNAERQVVPVAGGQGAALLPDARWRAGSGAPMGNRNALKHGYYTAEASAQRRELAAHLRRTRATIAGMNEEGR